MKKSRWAVNIFFAIGGFLFANYTSRLPDIQSRYHLNDGEIGVSLLILAIGALISMPFTGYMIVRNSSRKMTIASAIIYICLIPLIGFLTQAWLLNITLFIIGLTVGMLDVSMNAQAIVVEKNFKRAIMSSFHALYSAGMMIGAGSGALFIYLKANLFLHIIIVSAFSLFLVLIFSRFLVEDEHQIKGSQTRIQLPKASLVGVGLIAFCCMLGEGAMANWSTNYMLNVTKAQASFAPAGLFAFSGAMMLARFFGDRFRTMFGDRLLLIINSILAGIGLLFVLAWPIPLVAIFGFFLVGLGLSVIVPIVYSTAGNTPGIAPGVGIGMVTTIGYSGLLLGPPVIGFLAEWQGLQVALLFTLVLFLIMTLLSYKMKPARIE